MLFNRKVKISSGENIYLEKAALHLALRGLKTSRTFKEDGIENKDGLLQTYDGIPNHLVCLSFITIQEYCKEHGFEYWGGVDDLTGMVCAS